MNVVLAGMSRKEIYLTNKLARIALIRIRRASKNGLLGTGFNPLSAIARWLEAKS